ncbi:MAG: ribonuclease PH [Thermoleophilia bacterium]
MRTVRKADELRPLNIECGVIKPADGSALIKIGETHVLCTAKFTDGVPGWLRGSGRGWLTAEYSMLPASTATRTPREAVRGKQSGRTQEIQRLIGRSLRAVTDLGMLKDRTLCIDCDVLQADGGTRTASISGAYVALYLALAKLQEQDGLAQLPLFDSVAAVSVGVVDGRSLLDLDYDEDVAAEVDMNVVMTGSGNLIEVQATAEGEPFARATLDGLVDLATAGCATISGAQTALTPRAVA